MEMNNQLMEIAFRIKEMREVCGFSEAEMAEKTDCTVTDTLHPRFLHS